MMNYQLEVGFKQNDKLPARGLILANDKLPARGWILVK